MHLVDAYLVASTPPVISIGGLPEDSLGFWGSVRAQGCKLHAPLEAGFADRFGDPWRMRLRRVRREFHHDLYRQHDLNLSPLNPIPLLEGDDVIPSLKPLGVYKIS